MVISKLIYLKHKNNYIRKKDIKDINFCQLDEANNYFSKTILSVDDINKYLQR